MLGARQSGLQRACAREHTLSKEGPSDHDRVPAAVQIWSYNDQAQKWEQEPAPMAGGHSDWVRDVAWAPSLGLPFHTIASAGQV